MGSSCGPEENRDAPRGAELYIEFNDVDWTKASDWVLENVKPYLGLIPSKTISCNREEAAQVIQGFTEEKPEFWAYFADYDWVLLCQLFGRMIDLPDGWPMYCRDLKQLMDDRGYSKADLGIENTQEHNALADAKWNLAVYNRIIALDREKERR